MQAFSESLSFSLDELCRGRYIGAKVFMEWTGEKAQLLAFIAL